ncbi:hypothetical protein [Streptomyces fuscigenes]|uniref:hypothetical protein n=1 Tax=Streptomyces fuscigenes TaxID=1528880 RepID=UPI001F3693FE|nr:hypothetical protein [Streptomyces fuscigenes]MCF3960323.1 hypothetical protein [Streptomyces fuscigenes]
MNELQPARVRDIRDLTARLAAAPADEAAARALLTECRTALTDLLKDRDALIHANAEAGEQLAAWTGAL